MQITFLSTLFLALLTLRAAAVPPRTISGGSKIDMREGTELSTQHDIGTTHTKRVTIKGTIEAIVEAVYKWVSSGDLGRSIDSKDVYAIVNDGDTAFRSMSRYADRAERMLQNDGQWAVLVIEQAAIVQEPGPGTHRKKIQLNFQPSPFWNKPEVILANAYYCHDDGTAKVKKYKPDGSEYKWAFRGDALLVGDLDQVNTPPADRVYTIEFSAWGHVDSVYGSGSP